MNNKILNNGPLLCLATSYHISNPLYFHTFGRTLKEGKVCKNSQERCFLVYSEKGKGKILINGEWQLFEKGSLAYIPRNSIVHYYAVGDKDWQISFITFAGRDSESILKNKAFVINSNELNIFPSLIDELYIKYGEKDFNEFSFGALYFLLLRLGRIVGSVTNVLEESISLRMKLSLRTIMRDFSVDISVSELAKNCGISEEYYCRIFKKITGLTPVKYINSLRVAKACDILKKYQDKRIEKVAEECGYSNVTYFNKLFKREMGITPSEYRKNIFYQD